MTIKKMLVFIGCFSFQLWGMIGVPNDDFNEQPSRLVQQLVNLDGYDSATDSENEQSELSETLGNSLENISDYGSETEDIDISETEVILSDEEENEPPQEKSKLDIKKLISKGDTLTTEAKKNFYELLIRERDLDYILDMVWNKCFDHSFKIKPTKVNGIYKGEGIDKNFVFFAEKNINRSIDTANKRGLLYSDENMDAGIRTKLTDTVLFGMKPLSFKPADKDKIKEYIKQIMNNPVGCKMILFFLANCLAENDLCKKIKLVKVKNKNFGFDFIPGKSLWEYKEFDEEYQRSLNEQSPKHKFFVFSSNWLKRDVKTLFLRLNKENPEGTSKGSYTLSEESHKEIGVAKAIYQSQHHQYTKKHSKCSKDVGKIIQKNRLRICSGKEIYSVNTGSILHFVFPNDAALQAIFMTSPYSVDAYGGIDLGNIKDKRKCYLKPNRSNQERSVQRKVKNDKTLKHFLLQILLNSNCIDHAVFNYYLSGEYKKGFDDKYPCIEFPFDSNVENSIDSSVALDSEIENSPVESESWRSCFPDYFAFFKKIFGFSN